MAGLVPAIHVLHEEQEIRGRRRKAWSGENLRDNT
jgi:hypothetical protein